MSSALSQKQETATAVLRQETRDWLGGDKQWGKCEKWKQGRKVKSRSAGADVFPPLPLPKPRPVQYCRETQRTFSIKISYSRQWLVEDIVLLEQVCWILPGLGGQARGKTSLPPLSGCSTMKVALGAASEEELLTATLPSKEVLARVDGRPWKRPLPVMILYGKSRT